MPRKLVAAFACRAGGTRLYGKPLQNLKPDYNILQHLIEGAKASPEIDEIVLGIAEGLENEVFASIAREQGVEYIFGSEKDVLWRLVQCGRSAAATDIFRVTSECPFVAWELLQDAWAEHVEGERDITVSDYLPEGAAFEIYTQSALETSHRDGLDEERSEYCSAYARRNVDLFNIALVQPVKKWQRMDLRLTVDYPEDLILCREIFHALSDQGPRIPFDKVLAFADSHPELTRLVEPYVDQNPLWASVLK